MSVGFRADDGATPDRLAALGAATVASAETGCPRAKRTSRGSCYERGGALGWVDGRDSGGVRGPPAGAPCSTGIKQTAGRAGTPGRRGGLAVERAMRCGCTPRNWPTRPCCGAVGRCSALELASAGRRAKCGAVAAGSSRMTSARTRAATRRTRSQTGVARLTNMCSHTVAGGSDGNKLAMLAAALRRWRNW